jgi:lysophospholipase L1-like esterase
MRKKLLIVLIFAFVITFVIYLIFQRENKIYYIALGDGMALGENPYSTYGYGYPDFIKDYLKEKNRLSFFTKAFAKEDLRTIDLIKQIEDNYTISINDKKLTINQAINKANLITLSIGNVDLFYKLKINNNYFSFQDIKNIYKDVNEVFKGIEDTIKYLRENYHKKLVVVGFYNPLTDNEYINNEVLNEIFRYADDVFKSYAKKYNYIYIPVNNYIGGNKDLLPNPNSVHVNYNGYKLISDLVIEKLHF